MNLFQNLGRILSDTRTQRKGANIYDQVERALAHRQTTPHETKNIYDTLRGRAHNTLGATDVYHRAAAEIENEDEHE